MKTLNDSNENRTMIDLVLKNYQDGNLKKAEDICREIIKNQPENFDALHLLGLIYSQRGEPNKAIDYIKKALQLNPHCADAYNNMGIVFQRVGQIDKAIANYQKALQLRPELVQACYNLATAFQANGQLDEAIFFYQKTMKMNPDFAGTYYNMGIIFQMRGSIDKAERFYRKAIELAPNIPEAYYALAAVLQGKGQIDEAIRYYQKAIEIHPSYAEVYNNMGVIWQNKRDIEKAISFYQKAIQLKPEFEQAFNNLGNAYRDQGEWEKALESYTHAIKINPGYVLAYYNLGNILVYQGKADEAIAAYDKALKNKPDFITAQWAKCIAQLPIIYPDQESIQVFRNRYHDELIKLRSAISLESTKDIETAAEAVGSHQPFLLACEGLNDRDLQKLYGDLVCTIMAKKYPQFIRQSRPSYSPGEPLRIGIVSAYFHFHSIWKIPLRGWIENFDTMRYHLYGYYTGRIKDHATESARRHCRKFVEDVSSFEDLCKIILNDKLHVLLYPEIGMDTMTLRLASLRLAPVQCTSLGHPDTSGLPTIDYFLSSELMEPSDGDKHYTERLIHLPNLGFYYTPFEVPAVEIKREDLGLRPESILYLCSHALFTYLPQYDEVFPRIAKQIGDCQFLFISHQDRNDPVTEQFHMRLKAAFHRLNLTDEPYVVFLPPLSPTYYHAVNALSDIFLDSIGWSANNSTFEAIACNLPIVTLPGKLMRQRHCVGILTMMGITETIASTLEEYIALTVRLGKDTAWRRQISEEIATNKHRLYHDKTCINALQDFLVKVIKERV